MEKIFRECKHCNLQATEEQHLKMFVSDKSRINNFYTKPICKKCNARIAQEKKNKTYIYPDKSIKCKDCGLRPSTEESKKLFVKASELKNGYANLCKSCASKRTMKHQKENPEMFKKRQRRYLLASHGLTEDKYEKIMAKQQNGCAICKEKFETQKRTHIDHDHSCCPETYSCGDCIRGILCAGCNMMLGMARDNKKILQYAIIYLEKGV